MKSAELWTKRKQRILEGIEDALSLAIADAEGLEADRHMNGRKQDVAALRNRLAEAKSDARELREKLGTRPAEITENVDEELAKKAAERNGQPVEAAP